MAMVVKTMAKPPRRREGRTSMASRSLAERFYGTFVPPFRSDAAKGSGAAGQVVTVEPSHSTTRGIGRRSTRRHSGPTLE
jgi:hypothetical protein